MLMDVRILVQSFGDSADGSAIKSQELILQLLDHTAAPFDRNQFGPGHITCTGLVFAPGLDAVLFVHHARLKRWLLPGGHVEAEDTSAIATARREVIEETAVRLNPRVQPFLAGLDVHGIPPRRDEPFHLHHDLIVGFVAEERDVERSEESNNVAWLEPSRLALLNVPESIRRSILRASNLLL